jgi:Cu2+-exporting ATPase
VQEMMQQDRALMSDPHAGHKMTSSHAGHDRHAGHSVAMFRDKFWLSLTLTIPVVFWSTDVQHWFGYTAPSFPSSSLVAPVLGTIVFVYGGLVFIRGAWSELAERKPGMMTLISLAIAVAFGTSLAATFGLFQIEVWWELASLMTIMILGHWLEMRAIAQARGALNALAALFPDTAERVNDAEIQTVPISELVIGDVANPEQSRRDWEPPLLRERSRAGAAFESASRQSARGPHSRESCGSSLPRRLRDLAPRPSPIVLPPFSST